MPRTMHSPYTAVQQQAATRSCCYAPASLAHQQAAVRSWHKKQLNIRATRLRNSAASKAAPGSTASSSAAAAAAAALPSQQQTLKVANPEGGAPFPITIQVPPGAEVYQVALKKPLGFTLAEKPGGVIVVDELQPGGHAEQGGIAVGDVLLAVTARSQEAGSSNPKLVLLQTKGQSFKTVAAGLRSNTCSQCSIILLLQRQRHQ